MRFNLIGIGFRVQPLLLRAQGFRGTDQSVAPGVGNTADKIRHVRTLA